MNAFMHTRYSLCTVGSKSYSSCERDFFVQFKNKCWFFILDVMVDFTSNRMCAQSQGELRALAAQYFTTWKYYSLTFILCTHTSRHIANITCIYLRECSFEAIRGFYDAFFVRRLLKFGANFFAFRMRWAWGVEKSTKPPVRSKNQSPILCVTTFSDKTHFFAQPSSQHVNFLLRAWIAN